MNRIPTAYFVKCVTGVWVSIDPLDLQAWLDSVRPATAERLHGVVIAFGVCN